MDLLTPVIFGAFNFLLNSEKGNNEHYILLAIVFSTSVPPQAIKKRNTNNKIFLML